MGFLSVELLPLFAFFAPGFVFLLAFYGGGRLARSFFARGLLLDAAALVLVSALLNLIAAPAYLLVTRAVVSGAFQRDALALIEDGLSLDAFPWRSYAWLLGYVAFVLAAAGWLGYKTIRWIETRSDTAWIRFVGERFTHQSLYALVEGAESGFDSSFERGSRAGLGDRATDYVMAGVLTDVGPDERPVIYYGRVSRLVVSNINTLESIALRDVEKFTLTIDDKGARTPPRTDYVRVFDGVSSAQAHANDDKLCEFLLIEGRTIKNVSFERFRYSMTVSSEADKAARDKVMGAAP